MGLLDLLPSAGATCERVVRRGTVTLQRAPRCWVGHGGGVADLPVISTPYSAHNAAFATCVTALPA